MLERGRRTGPRSTETMNRRQNLDPARRSAATLLAALSVVVGCPSAGDKESGSGPSTVAVQSSSPISCDAPRDQPFEAVLTAARHDANGAGLVGAALGIEDYDQDGVLDVFLPAEGSADGRMLWGVDGSTFDEVDVSAWGPLDGAAAVSHADYDGDGDLDLFVARWAQPSALLRNEGGREFVDVTAESGLGTYAVRAQTAPWGDIDGDGDLDLFVGAYGEQTFIDDACADHVADEHPGQLWQNNGDGTFTDRSDQLPEELDGHEDPAAQDWDAYVFMAGFFDLDGDHRPELLVAIDDGVCQGSLALANQGGGFVVGGADGWGGTGRHDMGMAAADLNGDELPDFAIPSYQHVTYLESSHLGEAPIYVEAGQAVGIDDDWTATDRIFGWGAEFGDLDNDADEDLISLFGFWDYFAKYNPEPQPDAMFIRGDDGRFSQEAEAWGLADEGVSRSVVLADLDRDGALDVVTRVLDNAVDATAVTNLHLSNCEQAAWLTVRLRDERTPNGFAVGAKVRAITDRSQVRWITASSTGMYSARPLEAHFGLGAADRVDLEVVWPDGETTRVDDVPARQVVTLHRKP